MFDDVYKTLEDMYQLDEEVVGGDTRQSFADGISRMLGDVTTNLDVTATNEYGAMVTTKLAKFNINNYYSIRFDNSSGFNIEKSIKGFDEFEKMQYSNSIRIFNENPKHKNMLIAIIAFRQAELNVKSDIKKFMKRHSGKDYPITRNTTFESIKDSTARDIFTLYGDQGYNNYVKVVAMLNGKSNSDTGTSNVLTVASDGSVYTDDANLNVIIDTLPYVLVGSGSEYYILKPKELVTELRNALKSGISAHVPQGVTIHELISGKFSTKVINPEKGAFINRIKDPSSNKPFDYKSQNPVALNQFHDDILEIFFIGSKGANVGYVGATAMKYSIMYLSQTDFDRAVKKTTTLDRIQAGGKAIGKHLNSAKGHLI